MAISQCEHRDLPIDWRRMAAPQEDQYDTDVVLQLVSSSVTRFRREPYSRRSIGSERSIFDDQVAVRYIVSGCPYQPPVVNAPLDHPNITTACNLVRRWPVVFRQFQRLIDSFHPLWEETIPFDVEQPPLFSCSGADESRFGTLYATVINPFTLAEAFVHEMAHQKLHGLGISLESAPHLIVNPPDRLYRSPVIRDRLRPMTAVLHAEYSFLYMTRMDIAMFRAETNPAAKKSILQLMAGNLRRIEMGLEELKTHAETDDNGADFLDGLFAWAEAVISEAREILGTGDMTGKKDTLKNQSNDFGHRSNKVLPEPIVKKPQSDADVIADAQAKAPSLPLAQSKHVVALFSNGYGDFVLAWPTLRALASFFPGRLTLVSREGVSEQFFTDLTFRNRIAVPMQVTSDRSGLGFDSNHVADAIGQCDLFLSLNPWHSLDVDNLIGRISPKWSVGYSQHYATRLWRNYSKHAAELTFDVARTIDPSADIRHFWGAATFSVPLKCQSMISTAFPDDGPILLVHTSTVADRTWPLDRMREVLVNFLTAYPHFRLGIYGTLPSGLAAEFGARVVDCNHLSIAGIASLVSRSIAFLGVDSWILHLADLAQVPSIGLFGPLRVHEWGFLCAPNRSICAAESLLEIRAESVFEALEATVSSCQQNVCEPD